MADNENITFKVAPDVALKLTEAGHAKGKSRHLVAKEIVLNALLNEGSKSADSAVVSALFDLREELHQLSDYIVEQKEVPEQRTKKRRPSRQMRQLVRAIATLQLDVAKINTAPSSTRELDSMADCLGRQTRAVEDLAAKLNELVAVIERDNIVAHFTAFANKSHKYQTDLGEHTSHLLDEVQQEYCEIIRSHMQIRHDIARTLKLMLGYVENISQAQADRLVENLLISSRT